MYLLVHFVSLLMEVSVLFFLSQTLIATVDKKTGERSKTRPRYIKQDQIALARFECAGVLCMETFSDFQQMGRFTLRDEGKKIIWCCTSSALRHSQRDWSRVISLGIIIQIMNVYECNGANIFMGWKMECSIQRAYLNGTFHLSTNEHNLHYCKSEKHSLFVLYNIQVDHCHLEDIQLSK